MPNQMIIVLILFVCFSYALIKERLTNYYGNKKDYYTNSILEFSFFVLYGYGSILYSDSFLNTNIQEIAIKIINIIYIR